jgi:hypothetical protein
VQGYARNITDETTITNTSYSGLWNAITFGLADPRTYGVRFAVNW